MAERESKEHSASAAQRRWRWWHSALTVLAFGLISFLLWHLYLYRAVETEHDRIRAEGLPATPAELDPWYQHVPDEENAALIWLHAFQLLRELPDPDRQELVPFVGTGDGIPVEPWEHYSADQLELMREYVALNQPAFDHATQSLRLNKSRFPVNLSVGFDAMLPALSPHRDMARTLRIFADLASADRHATAAAAAQSILLELSLAESLQPEPILISQLVVIAEQVLAVQTLERALNHLAFDQGQLRDLERAFHEAASHRPIYRAMIGERSNFVSMRDWFIDSERRHRYLAAFWQIAGVRKWNELRYLRMSQRLIDAQSDPYILRPAAVRAFNEEAHRHNWPGTYLGKSLPDYTRAQEIETKWAAQLQLAAVALPVERYRLAHGDQPPPTLDALVPDYLDAVPLDPFTDRPLLYRVESNGHYTVYSVGADLTDDGGLRENAAGKAYEPGADIVFEVRRTTPTPAP